MWFVVCGSKALGNVIAALTDERTKFNHVPYRESKLTRLLQVPRVLAAGRYPCEASDVTGARGRARGAGIVLK